MNLWPVEAGRFIATVGFFDAMGVEPSPSPPSTSTASLEAGFLVAFPLAFPLAFALAFPLVVAPLRPEVTLGGRPRRGADAPEAAAGAVLGPRLGRGTTLLFSMGSSEGFAACAVASGSCQIICSGCDVSPKSYRVENSLD